MTAGPADDRLAFRRQVLIECGAPADGLDELLRYTDNDYRGQAPVFPLADEPHIEAWLAYERDARECGAFAALQRRFVQLRFPVREGMSGEADYRAATRQGRREAADPYAPGLVLDRPEEVDLAVCSTLAGRVPVIMAPHGRADFVALVRAFSARNEPEVVPDSMGACLVKGLNNWDRIATHRQAWEEAQPAPPGEEAWAEEFRRLVPHKELYQDRFIILSRGAYSALAARETGFTEDEWRERSLVLRREHEFTHYFTVRVFGAVRNHVFDEVLADFVGLLRALGSYRPDLALRFLGLEDHPRYREGGRIENYRGTLSDEALAVVRALAYRSIQQLGDFAHRHPELLGDLTRLARVTCALFGLTLEELASAEMDARVMARLA